MRVFLVLAWCCLMAPCLATAFFPVNRASCPVLAGQCPLMDGGDLRWKECAIPGGSRQCYIKFLGRYPSGMGVVATRSIAEMTCQAASQPGTGIIHCTGRNGVETASELYAIEAVSNVLGGLQALYTIDGQAFTMWEIHSGSAAIPCATQVGQWGVNFFVPVCNSTDGAWTCYLSVSMSDPVEDSQCVGKVYLNATQGLYRYAAATGQFRDGNGTSLPDCNGKVCRVASQVTALPTLLLSSNNTALELGAELWPSLQAYVKTLPITECSTIPEWYYSVGMCNGGTSGATCTPDMVWSTSSSEDLERSAVCDYCSLWVEANVFSPTGLEVVLTGQSNAMLLEVGPPNANWEFQYPTDSPLSLSYSGFYSHYTTTALGGGNGGSTVKTFRLRPGRWAVRIKVGKAAIPGPIGVAIRGARGTITTAATETTTNLTIPVYHGRSYQPASLTGIGAWYPIQGRVMSFNSNYAGCLEWLHQGVDGTLETSPAGYKCTPVEGTIPLQFSCNDPCETTVITKTDGLVGSFELIIDKSGQVVSSPGGIDAEVVRGTGLNCVNQLDVTLLFQPNPNLCPAKRTWSMVLDALCWLLIAIGVGLIIWALVALAKSCKHGSIARNRAVSRLKAELRRKEEEELRARVANPRASPEQKGTTRSQEWVLP